MNAKTLTGSLLMVGLLWAAAPDGQAQQGAAGPHLGYAYPAGGRQGATVEVLVGGQLLTGVTGGYVTGNGVDVVVGEYTRPLSQKEFQDIRDKLTEAAKTIRPRGGGGRAGVLRNQDPEFMGRVAKEAGITEKELKAFLLFVKSRQDPKIQLNPQISESVALKIRIGPQAEPGIRELRLVTGLGMTNPIRFVVGRLPEHNEVEPNDKSPDDVGSALPVVLNGQITPGDVDRFAFTAKKGAKLVISAAARELTPYLADAVPGWFQVTVAVYDANGREVAFSDHNQFRQDPAFLFKPPEDGRYTLVVQDAIFRGRDDFVYRITVGDVPYVTGLFPLGGPVGKETTVQAFGWNLPAGPVKVGSKQPGTVDVCVGQGKASSNCVPFEFDTLLQTQEKEPNSDAAHAQLLTLPVAVNGRIDKPGDVDVYLIKAKAGGEIVAEVTARRLGSPVDSTLQLTDSKGKQIAFNDDFNDIGAGLVTHQADSYLTATVPTAGNYYLKVGDAQHKGGPEFGYRLRVAPPQPDFELRVVPSSISARAGMSVPVTVYALRRDGFSGDIALSLKGAPDGFELAGGWVPGSADKMRMTLTAPGSPDGGPVKLQLEGKATIQGKEVRHLATPAEDQMQAFLYRHLVPMDDLLVAVIGRQRGGIRFAMPEGIVKIPSTGKVQVRIGGPTNLPAGQLRLSMSDGPEGISIQNVAAANDGFTITLVVDPAKAKPGLKGNLIIDLSVEREQPAAAGRPAARRRAQVGTLPAIPFEVVK
jgi:hypothetical protein